MKGRCASFMLCVLMSGLLSAKTKEMKKHIFVNESDMPLSVSVLYRFGKRLDRNTIPVRGTLDRTGNELPAEWELRVKECLRHIHFRDAAANEFLVSEGKQLKIPIDIVSNKTSHNVVKGLVQVGTIYSASQGDVGGTLLGTATSAELDRQKIKQKNPLIECSQGSRWVYSGSQGNYTLKGPQEKTWKIVVKERLPRS